MNDHRHDIVRHIDTDLPLLSHYRYTLVCEGEALSWGRCLLVCLGGQFQTLLLGPVLAQPPFSSEEWSKSVA